MRREKTVGEVRPGLAAALAGLVDSPYFAADHILVSVLGVPRAELHAHPERTCPESAVRRARELCARLAAGEPLAYVLGDALFYGRAFRVDSRVLIPRPETESLAAWGDRRAKETPGCVFADWCTGSGVLAITLLLENPASRAYAVDSSGDALAVARENACLWGVEERMTFIHSPTPEGVLPDESLDFIVANPPYIPEEEMTSLERAVRDFEPHEALDGGPGGGRVLAMLLDGLAPLMKPGALAAFETAGKAQAAALAAGVRPLVFEGLFSDERGIGRFMVWRKPI